MDEKYLIAVLVAAAAVAIYCGKIIFDHFDYNFKLIINKSPIEIIQCTPLSYFFLTWWLSAINKIHFLEHNDVINKNNFYFPRGAWKRWKKSCPKKFYCCSFFSYNVFFCLPHTSWNLPKNFLSTQKMPHFVSRSQWRPPSVNERKKYKKFYIIHREHSQRCNLNSKLKQFPHEKITLETREL